MGLGREIRFVAIVTGVSQTQQSKTNDFLVTLPSSSSLPPPDQNTGAFSIVLLTLNEEISKRIDPRSAFLPGLVGDSFPVWSESNRGVNCARLEVSPIAIADDKNPLFAVAAVIVTTGS